MKLNFDGVMATSESQQTDGYKKRAPSEALSQAERMAKQEREENLTLLEMSRNYNKNMLVMGRTPEYLYKGMKAGLPIEELFMIAVRGVASALSDPLLEKVMARGLEERANKAKEEK